jgi:hypothetical protein
MIAGLSNNGVNDIMTNSSSSNGGPLCQQFYNQAKLLNAFFANTTGLSGGLAAKFAALQGAEKTIGNTAINMPNLASYLGTVNTQRTAIINKIFEGKDRTDFDLYFDAYTKGNYLISADWNTRTDGSGVAANISNAVDQYKTARGLTGLSLGDTSSNIYINRGRVQVATGSITSQLNQIQAAMETQIVEALGLDTLTGEQLARANAMADALIIQLGQDHEEFTAFVNDLQASGSTFSTALGWDYKIESIAQIASLGSQSSTRLAALV